MAAACMLPGMMSLTFNPVPVFSCMTGNSVAAMFNFVKRIHDGHANGNYEE